MSNLVLAPMSHNSRTRRLQAKKRVVAIGSGKPSTIRKHRRTIAQATYKKDWLKGRKYNVLDDKPIGVEWRGWLYEDDLGKEVPMGWCNKGNHYIAWELRHGHLEECMWRGGRLYGK